MDIKIRLTQPSDLDELCALIKRTVEESFIKVYPTFSIKYVLENQLNIDRIKKRMENDHFYVATNKGKIIGCACIGVHRENENWRIIKTVFVDPKCQGSGIGKMLIDTLEADARAGNAIRIEVPASLFAVGFYKHLGYEHVDGELHYSDGHFAMEKFLS